MAPSRFPFSPEQRLLLSLACARLCSISDQNRRRFAEPSASESQLTRAYPQPHTRLYKHPSTLGLFPSKACASSSPAAAIAEPPRASPPLFRRPFAIAEWRLSIFVIYRVHCSFLHRVLAAGTPSPTSPEARRRLPRRRTPPEPRRRRYVTKTEPPCSPLSLSPLAVVPHSRRRGPPLLRREAPPRRTVRHRLL